MIEAKAAALVEAGRVVIDFADAEGRIRATVEGDHGTYRVRCTAAGRWSCSCTAATFGAACSHVAAVQFAAQPEWSDC